MFTNVTDFQTVGEVEAKAFGLAQQGATNVFVTLKNDGVNTITYRFQELVGSTWTDADEAGTDFNDTLAEGEEIAVALVDLAANVRLMAYASGGSVLSFSVARYFNWTSGGFLPLVAA